MLRRMLRGVPYAPVGGPFRPRPRFSSRLRGRGRRRGRFSVELNLLFLPSNLAASRLTLSTHSFDQDFSIFQRVLLAKLIASDLSVNPYLAHWKDFWAEMDVIEMPDENGQERQNSFVAMHQFEEVVHPDREKSE